MRTSPSRFLPRLRRCMTAAVVAAALLGSTGCVYRMAIQQGNYLDPEQIRQLEPGMTRSQVMFLLGTPMIPTAFNEDRWDYYYSLKAKILKAPITSRLTVHFEGDKVSRVDLPEGIDARPAPADPRG